MGLQLSKWSFVQMLHIPAKAVRHPLKQGQNARDINDRQAFCYSLLYI